MKYKLNSVQKITLIALLIVVIFSLPYFLFKGNNYSPKHLKKRSSTLEIRNWQMKDLGNGLWVELPFDVHLVKMNLSQETKEKLKDARAYLLETEDSFLIAISSNEFNIDLPNLNIEEEANNSIEGLKNEKGVYDLSFKQTNSSDSFCKKIIQHGNYVQSFTKYSFIYLDAIRNRNTYHINIEFKNDSKNYEQISERIINSVEIK